MKMPQHALPHMTKSIRDAITTPPSCAIRALHHGISPLPRRPRSQSFLQKICHRPSTPRTTRRDLAPGPTNSGYLRSFLRRAAAKATPSVTAAPRLAVPSPCKSKPSTTTSNLLSSAGWIPMRSNSLTSTLVVTRPPASRHIRAAALNPAPGPLVRPHQGLVMRGKICVSRWARSTRDAASSCHPHRAGSNSSGWTGASHHCSP